MTDRDILRPSGSGSSVQKIFHPGSSIGQFEFSQAVNFDIADSNRTGNVILGGYCDGANWPKSD